MTRNEAIQQFVKFILAQRNQNRMQAPATSGGGNDNGYSNILSTLLKAGAKKGAKEYIVKPLWKEYVSPYWKEYVEPFYKMTTNTGAGGEAGLEASSNLGQVPTWEGASNTYTSASYPTGETGAVGTEAATGATNIMGGALGSEGLSGVSWGGALSLLAPLAMSYLRYQAGSGENTPVRMQRDTTGLAGYLADMAKGNKLFDPKTEKNPYDTFDMFNRNPDTNPDSPNYLYDNPNSWTPKSALDTWYSMMQTAKFPGSKGINSTLSPTQIYNGLRKQGVTDEWLEKNVGGINYGHFNNPDFSFQEWERKYGPSVNPAKNKKNNDDDTRVNLGVDPIDIYSSDITPEETYRTLGYTPNWTNY